MKTNLLLLVATFMVIIANATILTVNNNPAGFAQYNTIQAAINAAESGDTILVHGSETVYAGFTINNKKLAIIGPGVFPDKNLGVRATVQSSVITGAGATGSEVQGLLIDGITVNGTLPESIIITRNYFNGWFWINSGGNYKDYLIETNYFNPGGGVHGSISAGRSYTNLVIRNNVFDGNQSQIREFDNASSSIIIDHNMFYRRNGFLDGVFSSSRFLLITNNIFVRRNAADQLSQSTFTNNITFNCPVNNPWAVNSNFGGGNIENQDPQMADQAIVNAGNEEVPLRNLSIAAGPAKGTAADGKDIGLLFEPTGPINWALFRHSRLPRIFSMNITNPSLPAGGTLSVEVEARRSN
jgi:hypothetical protein